jgi:aspartate carbamoyltransferase catalytic subunit
MLRLGGGVIGFSGTSATSVSKGETLIDTVKIVSNYADVIVMRHPSEGAAYAASIYSKLPVINAGDGGHFHPTQTMADLFAISKLKNKQMKGFAMGICGDLLYGRTVHSLLGAFSLYRGNTFYLISTPALKTPEYFLSELKKHNKIILADTIEECLDKLDIIYMTRIQRERFKTEEEYESQAGIYILDEKKLKKAKNDLTILHPLPKNDEISAKVDDDPRAKYFYQAELGMYIRMALLVKILENPKPRPNSQISGNGENECGNMACVTNAEKYLPNLSKAKNGEFVCAYCETKF